MSGPVFTGTIRVQMQPMPEPGSTPNIDTTKAIATLVEAAKEDWEVSWCYGCQVGELKNAGFCDELYDWLNAHDDEIDAAMLAAGIDPRTPPEGYADDATPSEFELSADDSAMLDAALNTTWTGPTIKYVGSK